ncbi:MAG TPA: hypothetical protein VF138_01045 [Caulobacteraceae bacterium]
MVFAEFERRARRTTAHRIKLFVQMLTTIGYAAAGGALADPLFGRGTFGASNLFTLSLGVAALAVALYYVPDGEYDAH